MIIKEEASTISEEYQVVIPVKIREAFGIEPGDKVLWISVNNELHVKLIKKDAKHLIALIGAIDMGSTDSVKDIDEVTTQS